ncbi:MAG: hypothetical protein N3A71_03405 [Candidatus Dojkabacteria bacterium]|nr:hypothetical protein [Candidatus Dojkabacteria bacterium]
MDLDKKIQILKSLGIDEVSIAETGINKTILITNLLKVDTDNLRKMVEYIIEKPKLRNLSVLDKVKYLAGMIKNNSRNKMHYEDIIKQKIESIKKLGVNEASIAEEGINKVQLFVSISSVEPEDLEKMVGIILRKRKLANASLLDKVKYLIGMIKNYNIAKNIKFE